MEEDKALADLKEEAGDVLCMAVLYEDVKISIKEPGRLVRQASGAEFWKLLQSASSPDELLELLEKLVGTHLHLDGEHSPRLVERYRALVRNTKGLIQSRKRASKYRARGSGLYPFGFMNLSMNPGGFEDFLSDLGPSLD